MKGKLTIKNMGRIRKNIIVDGRACWTLFDTGARNTYVIESVADGFNVVEISKPRKVALGGKESLLNKLFILIAEVEGFPVEIDAYILENIGRDEDGKAIEVLFGALAMQKWGIRPIPDKERLDLTNYSKEFVEF